MVQGFALGYEHWSKCQVGRGDMRRCDFEALGLLPGCMAELSSL